MKWLLIGAGGLLVFTYFYGKHVRRTATSRGMDSSGNWTGKHPKFG